MVTTSINTRLQKLEEQSGAFERRRVAKFVVDSYEDAEKVEEYHKANPDDLVIVRVIAYPPVYDAAEENIIAPARTYEGPIVKGTKPDA
jgi:hypothetical protein